MGITLFFVHPKSYSFIPIFNSYLVFCVFQCVSHKHQFKSVRCKFGVTNIWLLFWPTQPTLVFCILGTWSDLALTSQISDLVRGDAKPITSWEVMIILTRKWRSLFAEGSLPHLDDVAYLLPCISLYTTPASLAAPFVTVICLMTQFNKVFLTISCHS